MPIHGTSHSGTLAVTSVTAGKVVDSGELALTGEQAFSATGTINDLVLNSGVSVLRWSGASNLTATGISGGTAGRMVLLINESSGSAITLNHQNAGSLVANRLTLLGSTSQVLNGFGAALLRYDGSAWRIVAISTAQFNATLTGAGNVTFSSFNNPTSLSATNNDLAPTAAYRYRFAAAQASTITGLATGVSSGRIAHLQNISSFNITLSNEGAGSTAANRFTCARGVDMVIPPGGSAFGIYDSTTSRWIVYGDASCWSQGASTLTGELMSPPWSSGRYYLLPAMSVATGTSAAMGNGTLRFSLFYVPSPVTLTRIGAEVTLAGEAGSKVRLGIYADDGSGRPGALVVDAGQIDGTITGTQELAISTPAGPGWYWYATAVQSAPTTQPTIRTATTVPYNNDAGTTLPAPLTGSTSQGATQSGVTGALPNPAVITSMASGTTARAVVKT